MFDPHDVTTFSTLMLRAEHGYNTKLIAEMVAAGAPHDRLDSWLAGIDAELASRGVTDLHMSVHQMPALSQLHEIRPVIRRGAFRDSLRPGRSR